MIELPDEIPVYDLQAKEEISASVVDLSRSLEQRKIDGSWWVLPGVSKTLKKRDGDHHWLWAKLVGEHHNDLAWQALAATVGADNVEGAVLYRIDAVSYSGAGAPAVFVDRIATAPHNRPWLVETPRYRGIGEGLLARVAGDTALRAEIDESAWSALYSTKSQPFPAPTKKGKIAVNVINHYGDEVLKVYNLKDSAKGRG